MNSSSLILSLAYFAAFLGFSLAMIYWQRRRRKTRRPFGEDFKLLRAPGESQLRLYLAREENDFFWILGSALAPIAVAGLGAKLTQVLPASLMPAALGLTAVAALATVIVAAQFYARRTRRTWDHYLGYFGERIVAEHLEPLKLQGWRIVHDLPGVANGHKFNLDHVAIGPQGIFAIETKTRRKGNARPGYEEHKVFFDGRRLEWPWGEDNHGLEQAERNAIWLAAAIRQETGERVHVTPVLTLPGWWVENKTGRDARLAKVTNPKGLSKFMAAGGAVLTADQIAAIATDLEARCRDVEY